MPLLTFFVCLSTFLLVLYISGRKCGSTLDAWGGGRRGRRRREGGRRRGEEEVRMDKAFSRNVVKTNEFHRKMS